MKRIRALKQHYRQLKSDLNEFNPRGVFIPKALRDFFRDRITLERAKKDINKALETREDRFLELARTQMYERPTSPYLKLLKIAGCEFSDLVAQVHRSGLEDTLKRLAGEGVYLTVDEYKGKKDIVRGRESFRVSQSDFAPDQSLPGFVTQSSGTRNLPVRALSPLAWLAEDTLNTGIFLSAHGLFTYTHATYDPILPGAGGFAFLMQLAKLGHAPERWFAGRIPIDRWLVRAYNYAAVYETVLAAKFFGPGFPRPELFQFGDVRPIVRWVIEQRQRGKSCCIRTVASNSARIARAAREMGESLEGTKFISSGEPLTEGKREVIEQVGASTTLLYGYMPGPVHVSLGCANPAYTDEMHVNQNMLAIVPHPTPIAYEGPAIQPLLFTTLSPSAAKLQLNVDNGDYATLEKRDCGCALEKAGLTLHIHHVRSYEKFTSEGLNYFYGDLFSVLETTFPSEFGGGPGDYQLVEEEGDRGQTRLTLVVHPEVGTVDEERMIVRLQECLAEGSRDNRFHTKFWQDSGTLRVRREIPHVSARGKTLPLRIAR